jgi:hypothetical protein
MWRGAASGVAGYFWNIKCDVPRRARVNVGNARLSLHRPVKACPQSLATVAHCFECAAARATTDLGSTPCQRARQFL